MSDNIAVIGRSHSIRSCFPERHSASNGNTPILSPTECGSPMNSNLPGFKGSKEAPMISRTLSRHVHTNSTPSIFSQNRSVCVPSFYTLSANKKKTNSLTMYVPLYKAALKGDWNSANEFLQSHPDAVRAKITNGSETALHIAAGAKQTSFVVELVKLMSPADLAFQNKYNNTGLCFAAASGIIEIAEVMVKKNKDLPAIRGSKGVTPVYMAALLGHRDMVYFLYSVTRDDDLTEEDFIALLVATITTNLFDVALHIQRQRPKLAMARDGNGETALHVLARKPLAFFSGSQLKFWQRWIYSCIHLESTNANHPPPKNHGEQPHMISQVVPRLKGLFWHMLKIIVPSVKAVYDEKMMHNKSLELVRQLWEEILVLEDSKIRNILKEPSRPLFTATEFGIIEFVTELLQSYPDLLWKVDTHNRSIFHVAVEHRQEKIFNLIYEIGALKDMIACYKDDRNNNMLHLAAKLAPSLQLNTVSGAALQLQRELLWFKGVEKIVPPLYMEEKNSEGRTPKILFTEEHKILMKEGEKWMKDTSTSCMVVATLIATVMFAAVFTVPGGNSNDKGIPIFLQQKSFIVFAISDALALFSSISSMLMFLSILTSRYAEEDFLESLPKKLIIGLSTLFFSIAAMMIAFSATLFIVLGNRLAWAMVPIALVACIPVTLFALLQFPLLTDIMHSTYGSGIFSR